jgi:hypothetical protein
MRYKNIETNVLHAGIEPDPTTGAIMTPIFQTSTYVQAAPGDHKGYEYARTQNPTRDVLQNNLAALEGMNYGMCFSTGMGAVDACIKLLSPGDEVVSTNDLCIALRRLVEKIRNELNGNTSTTKNKELYNLALKNNIKVPDQRRPTDIKKIDKHGIPPIKIQEIKELPKKEEPKTNVLDCLSNIPKVKPLIISDDDDDISLETKVPTIVVPHVEAKLEAKVPTIVVPHVEAKLEAKVPANVELVMEDVNNDIPATKTETISAVVPENNVIKPQVTNISETVHTTITVVEGKRILNKLKNCDDVSNDDIDKIIVLYCDRCAKDQISMALKYMTISKKLEFLDEMIFLKYRFCNDDKTEILGGSKLNTIFRNLENK